MADVQQQIADGARPRLARVGDVIEHGQDIPANVVRLQDAEGDLRTARSIRNYLAACPEPFASLPSKERAWWPMKVVEVDPEPQPVETYEPDEPVHYYFTELRTYATSCGLGLEDDGDLRVTSEAGKATCDTCRAEADEDAVKPQPAESGPLVLTLPQVPDGTVALVDSKRDRWTRSTSKVPSEAGKWFSRDTYEYLNYQDVLAKHGPLTPEFAPPREPRVWPEIERTPDDLPDCVEVKPKTGFVTVWRRRTDAGFQTRYRRVGNSGQPAQTLSELRELGEVREVFDDGQ